ncbi:MAG TPA: glycosyltransferase family 2 protein [Alphaproteobacteria bacterium]|nr:glycosyltransferase family 2 protein [Alphaproteobacteria bacterium]
MSDMPTRISLVVPLFNEEKGIPLLAGRLAQLREKLKPAYELECLLVDDGSRDATVAVLQQTFAGTPHVRILEHGKNKGAGAAMRTGFQNASGEIVCTIDADCTFDPLEIPNLLEAMAREKADIAIGSPYHPRGGVENVVPWRLFLSKGASLMHRAVSRSKLYSYTSFLRAYRRDVLEKISFESNGFVAVTELLMKALLRGYTAVEVPTVLRRRVTGVSKMNVYRNIVSHLRLGSAVMYWRMTTAPSGKSAGSLSGSK